LDGVGHLDGVDHWMPMVDWMVGQLDGVGHWMALVIWMALVN
jgi:hypothetical protein